MFVFPHCLYLVPNNRQNFCKSGVWGGLAIGSKGTYSVRHDMAQTAINKPRGGIREGGCPHRDREKVEKGKPPRGSQL
jgi:hypothetical protein